MPFLNHRLRTLQTESFRNLGAAFSPSLFLFLSLNFVPKYLKISFLPLCIYKNVKKIGQKLVIFCSNFCPQTTTSCGLTCLFFLFSTILHQNYRLNMLRMRKQIKWLTCRNLISTLNQHLYIPCLCFRSA